MPVQLFVFRIMIKNEAILGPFDITLSKRICVVQTCKIRVALSLIMKLKNDQKLLFSLFFWGFCITYLQVHLYAFTISLPLHLLEIDVLTLSTSDSICGIICIFVGYDLDWISILCGDHGSFVQQAFNFQVLVEGNPLLQMR